MIGIIERPKILGCDTVGRTSQHIRAQFGPELSYIQQGKASTCAEKRTLLYCEPSIMMMGLTVAGAYCFSETLSCSP